MSNKYAQTNEEGEDIFQDRVEVELQKDWCKVFRNNLRVNQSGTETDLTSPEENLIT